MRLLQRTPCIPDPTLSIMKRCLAKLLALQNQDPWNDRLSDAIGHVLLWLGDEKNALIAFQQQLVSATNAPHHRKQVCDICTQQLKSVNKRFVCRMCESVDLCETCYSEDAQKNITFCVRQGVAETSAQHRFLVVAPVDIFPERYRRLPGIRTWNDQMIQIYQTPLPPPSMLRLGITRFLRAFCGST